MPFFSYLKSFLFKLTLFFKNLANSTNINHHAIEPTNAPTEKFKIKSELKFLKVKSPNFENDFEILKDDINKLIDWCYVGSPLSKVTEVIAEEGEVRNFETFEVKK